MGLARRLGCVGHFGALPEDDLQAIVAAGQMRRFGAGSVIFMEGEPRAGMFVLLSGRVHLCDLSPNGQQRIMHVIEPVIMFNEVAVLDGGPNPVMELAVDGCVTCCVSCAAYHDLLSPYPQVGLGLPMVMAQGNRMLMSRYEAMPTYRVYLLIVMRWWC